jgi:hypothetical protein
MKHIKALAVSLLIGLPCLAQNPEINVKHLSKLAKQASSHVEVTLQGSTLRLALRALKDDPETYKAVKDIKGIYTQVFEFEEKNNYSGEDVEIIKQQMQIPPWEQIVKVKEKDGDDIGVYILIDPNKDIIKGLVVLVAGEKELVFVNIVGDIDLDKLNLVGGNLGIPKLDLGIPKSN